MGASVARVEPRDFHAARKTGAFRHYAQPLALARAVLTRVGFDPNRPLDSAHSAVRLVPFRLATAELFERYVEASLRGALRSNDGHAVWAGYRAINLGKEFRIRPDYLVRSGCPADSGCQIEGL
jgi:5-methylcytosine-specific restriction endonuclease McrBC regulatory subunit McrC